MLSLQENEYRKSILTGTEKIITIDQIIPGKVYARFIETTTLLHFGIGTEDGKLIDLNEGRSEQSIQVITFDEFAKGKEVFEVDDSTFGFGGMLRDEIEVLSVAYDSLSIKKLYNLLSFNCGMFVYHCKIKSSPSIERAHPFIGQYPPAKLVTNE